MKLTFITLFLSTTGMFASVNSQNTRVNIHVNNANTQIVLNEIEKQTDYLFVYDTKEIDLNRKVSVEAQNKTVADVLSSVFTQTDISYAMEGNNIMLMRKNTSVTQQSNRRITGVVKDAIGEPIIGANIVVKGTTNGIITDINGNFSLMVSENAILQISYIGYQTQEIPTKGQTNIQITMKDDAQALDDVVVIGYGTQRKKDVAGSISSISTKDLSIQSSGNIQNLLQGRLSGVSVTTSGVAGDAPAIRIRGVGTLNNNSPLYVIDGFLSKIPTFTAKSVLKMKGDDFNIIYERNYRRSFLFTKSYVHDDMVAEDIVAESLVKYWRLVSAGENEITEALLLTILKNKALNYLRHKAIHDAAIENLEEIKNRELSIRISTLEACDPKEIFSDEVNRIIHKTLKNLPEQTHRIFEMSRFENKTVKEIADETNLTIKGVEYHITKALKALRINLKDYLPLFYFLFS